MNILVTGNKGYIGTVLTKILLKKNHKVTGLDVGYYDGCQFSDPDLDIKQIKKDIREVSEEDLKGIDVIMHLAGLSNDHISIFKPEITYDINFKATVRLAKLAKGLGIKKFIFASSCSVYGISGDEPVQEDSPLNPITPYAISKIKAEEALSKIANKDFSPVFLRPSTAYGVSPMLRCDLVVNNLTGWAYTTGKIKIMSDGTPWRPAIHVEDFSEGFLACLEAPIELIHNQAFNLGVNKENYQIKNIGNAIKKNMPHCEIEYTGEHGSDSRTYKVNFDKINTKLKDYFRPTWILEDGVKQLYEAFKYNNLTYEEFIGEKYIRLNRIKNLINKNKLDQNLFWVEEK